MFSTISIHYVHWKGKLAISSVFNEHEVLSFASEKAKLFAKNILKNNNLDDSSYIVTLLHCHQMWRGKKKLCYIAAV